MPKLWMFKPIDFSSGTFVFKLVSLQNSLQNVRFGPGGWIETSNQVPFCIRFSFLKPWATCQNWIEHVEDASIARVSGRLHPLDSTGNQRDIFCAAIIWAVFWVNREKDPTREQPAHPQHPPRNRAGRMEDVQFP